MAIASPGPDESQPVVPESGSKSELLRWLLKNLKECDEYLQDQTGYDNIQKSIDMVSGEMPGAIKTPKLSSTQSNRFRKIFFELTAGLTDTKPFWEYTSFNTDFQWSARLFNKLAEEWWEQNSIDQKWMGVIQYALVGSVGYAHVRYNQDTDDIDITPCDPRDVLPWRPSSIHSIQSAQAVFHREEKPFSYVLQRWPEKSESLQPDRTITMPRNRDASSRYSRMMQGLGLSNFQRALFGETPAKSLGKLSVVDVFRCYVKDHSLNETKSAVEVGAFKEVLRDGVKLRIPANDWSYTVEPGDPLYPNLRLIVFTRSAILYDGPSPFWHGMFPFVKVGLDPVPWSWLASSPMWPIMPLQESLNGLYRIVDDHAEKVARPDIIADKNSVPRATLDRVDTRRAGLKLIHNPVAGKGIVISPPPPLDPIIIQQIGDIKREMEELAGTIDLSKLSDLNQIPTTETVEKMMEAMTPAIRLRSRVLEAAVRELAYMVLSNFVQFYPLDRRVAVLGSEALTPEDLDSDLGTLIPDFSDSEAVSIESLLMGPKPRIHRAREFLRKFAFQVAPSSLLNASEIQRKLLYLQLFRAGVIDPVTLLEVLGIPNVGKLPGDPKTIMERMAVTQQAGFVGAVSAAGRKASGQQMPQMDQSGTISESG